MQDEELSRYSDRELIEELVFKIRYLEKEIFKMATNPPVTQAQFDTALAAFQTNLTTSLGEISQALTDLIAKVNSGAPIDLTAELNTINGMTTSLAATTATAISDDPGAGTSGVATNVVKSATVLPVPEQK